MRKKIQLAVLVFASVSIFHLSCQKETKEVSKLNGQENLSEDNAGRHHGNEQPTSSFSSELVVKWLNVQLDMLRVPLAPGTGSQDASRAMAYCGIAVYEAVVRGMDDYRSLKGQLTDFPDMPSAEADKKYFWPASANAALADMNRKLFPTTATANKTRIDSLENALTNVFATQTGPNTLQRSIAFGKEVAARVFAWAATDGSANVNPPYAPLPQFVGPAFWVQSVGATGNLVTTPPNFPAAVNPYASQRRLIVPDVTDGTTLAPPPAYSTLPSSDFYAMVKDVYDKSQALTPAQTAMALYHRDAPGYPGGGHFVAILSQVLTQANAKLDQAALAYVKTGLATNDAILICFTKKYTVNLVRPINYIRDVLGHATWTGLFNTPGHPEFPSAHAVNGAAIARMLTDVFGDNFHFTLNTYDYLGLPARSYNSFYDMGKEMADSRVFAGIHYQASCDKGRWLGEKVSENILTKIEFEKNGGHGHN
jgi:hypothetical protein